MNMKKYLCLSKVNYIYKKMNEFIINYTTIKILNLQ